VLSMTEAQYIKELYEVQGVSLREIAKRTRRDFRTVQKYAYREDWNPPVKLKMEPTDYPVLGKYIPVVNEWIEQDEKEPRKQRHTVSKIYSRLQKEHGYAGSYSSVRRYVALKREQMKKFREGFLPLEHPPGRAQVDFGKFKYYDALGIPQKGYALIVSFPNSNAGWMQVYQSENQECLLTGLKRIFYHIGGVPTRVLCDNMATAVAKILKGKERVVSDGFMRFMLHHRFAADFCNPASGNEKGNVENKVGYTRRNMLVPVPTITDWEGFNAKLLKLCDEDMNRHHYERDVLIGELWEDEKKHLLSLPEYEYEVFRYEAFSVDKQGFITIDTVRYSLSPEMNGKTVQAKIFFNKIEAYYDRQLIKTFVRSYEKGGEVCDWREYIPTLMKKPGAIEHTRFFRQMPKLWQEYLQMSDSRERKSALTVLSEIVSDGNDELCDEALALAYENGRADPDSVRQCYLLIAKPEDYPRPLELSTEPPPLNYQPDLSVYDGLMRGVAK